MAVKLHQSGDSRVILWALEQMQQEWPELDLFRWAKGESLQSKSEWIAANARFWLVWHGERLVGYLAATDQGRGRWVFHFGGRRVLPPNIFLSGWREFLEIAEREGVRLVAAYIPPERPAVRRMARLFQFRRFSKILWAWEAVYRNSNRRQRLRQKRPRKTRT